MTQALEIQGLRKTYANGVSALDGVDLSVREGDFFALLGPNGAGKSTTIGIVASLVRKDSGVVRVFGHDLDRDPEGVKANIGLVPQEFNFNQFEPVGEIVLNQAGFYGIGRGAARERTELYLHKLGLWDKRRGMARELSGGMKRRLMIARALVHEPRLLILDEPTAGVDIEIRRSMWAFLREINAHGTTIILTTHYLEEAENLCDHIAIINHGRTVESAKMNELLAQLHVETFVCNLRQPVGEAPQIDGYEVRVTDERTIEVDISKQQSINDFFAALATRGIHVTSLRNKVSRLEELFMRVVEGGVQ